MSENGEINTAVNKFYTAAGTDSTDKFHLCKSLHCHEQILNNVLAQEDHFLEEISKSISIGSFSKCPKMPQDEVL